MQKQERTKKWIASAFLELANQVPPGKITVKMLCDRAGVNRSTFYYHFDSIQVLIHWIYHQEVNEPVLKRIREEKAYSEISVLALSRIYERKAFWKKVLRLKTADEFTAFMLRDTKENWRVLIAALLSDQGQSMEALSHEKKRELEYIAEYYCAAHFHVTLLWMRQGMEPPPEEIANLMDSIASDGFYIAVQRTIRDRGREGHH